MRRSNLTIGFTFLAAGLLPAAEGRPEGVPDPAVAVQEAAFEVAEGFEINLFASEPMIAKPIQMNWDSAGRLWVVGSSIYPQIEPGQGEGDKLYVLEDTDGDGAADQSTVFAEGLHIPTAVMPLDGGAYVANSTQVLFLKDTDGDGKADERTVVLSGFGTEDTHHLLHTMRFGVGGLLYFNQSIYIHSHVETPYGIRRLLGGGVWQFRPETRELEVVSQGLVNPWGHVFDRWGQQFLTDGAGFEGINFTFPGAVFRTSPGASRFLPGLNPGQPKHCGLEVISGEHFPEDWQGHLIAPDFRGNRVNRFEVKTSGSGFVSAQKSDVVASTHRAFRPIDVRLGPDGALYIADWYNPIIQHGEVDFRDERRDHVHGRIWRVTAKARPLVNPPVIAGAAVPDLLEALRAPEAWTREMAKRELRERDRDKVIAALAKWTSGLGKSEDQEHTRLEALWAGQTVRHLDEALLRDLLASKNFKARAAATRVLWHFVDEIEDAEALFATLAKDGEARVRREAVTGLGALGTPSAMKAVLGVLERDMDEELDFALWSALRKTQGVWLPAVASGDMKLEKTGQAIFAMRAAGRRDLLPGLLEGVSAGRVKGSEAEAITSLAGEVGNADDLAVLMEWLGESANVTVLAALEDAVRRRKVKPSGNLSGLLDVMRNPDESIARAGVRLAGLWQFEPARQVFGDFLEQDQGSDALLRDMAVAMGAFKGQDQWERFRGLASGDKSMRTRRMAVIGALAMNPRLGAQLAVQVLKDTGEGDKIAPLVSALLANKQTPNLLAAALKGQEIPQGVALQLMQKAETSGMEVAKLTAALREAGGIKAMNQALSPEAMAAMVERVQREGDAHRGELVYRRKQLLCMTCHAIGETGGLVGPNLVSLGASAPVDYLIESMLEPSKKIKEGYHMTVLTTKSGDTYSGGLVSESPEEIVIRDAAGVENSVPAADVVQKITSPVSMMVPGLTASLREDEFIDLIRFLSELGKEGEFKTPPNRYVRQWDVVVPTPAIRDDMGFYGFPFFARADADLDWQPVIGTVAGHLLVDDLPTISGRLKGQPGRVDFGVARFALPEGAAESVTLTIDDPTGVSVILGEKAIPATKLLDVPLEKGAAHVIVVVNKGERKEPVRIEVR